MNKTLADAWFDAFRKKDISLLEKNLGKDFTHTSPYGTIKGKDAYLDLVRENSDAFFCPALEILDIIEGGNSFAVRYPVNGNPACDCIYVQNGQISEIFSYYHVGKKPNLYE